MEIERLSKDKVMGGSVTRLDGVAKTNTSLRRAPPDGGWGWVITFGAFLAYAIVWGVPRSLALLFDDFQRTFHSNKAQTSWISSLMLGGLTCGTLPGSFITNFAGPRKTFMFGGLLSAIGAIIISQAVTLQFAYLGSFLTGLGFGFAYCNATPQIGVYFDKKRTLAAGIAALGSPANGTIFPVLLRHLTYEYGWRGAMLVVAAYCLNLMVGGALLRPIPRYDAVRSGDDNSAGSATVNDTFFDSEKRASKTSSSSASYSFESGEASGGPREASSGGRALLIVAQYAQVAAQWRFALHIAFGFLDFFVRLCPTWFLVVYVGEKLHMTGDDGAHLFIFFSACDSVVRPLAGYLTTRLSLKLQRNGVEILMLAVNQLAMGIIVLCFPSATSFASVALLMSLFGLANGLNSTWVFPVTSRLIPVERLHHAVGIFHFISGIGLLIGPPFAGFLSDVSGNLDVVYLFSGATLVLSSAVAGLLYLLTRKYGISPETSRGL